VNVNFNIKLDEEAKKGFDALVLRSLGRYNQRTLFLNMMQVLIKQDQLSIETRLSQIDRDLLKAVAEYDEAITFYQSESGKNIEEIKSILKAKVHTLAMLENEKEVWYKESLFLKNTYEKVFSKKEGEEE